VKIHIPDSEKNCWWCGNHIWKKGNPNNFTLGYCTVKKKWFPKNSDLGRLNCRDNINKWVSMTEKVKKERKRLKLTY